MEKRNNQHGGSRPGSGRKKADNPKPMRGFRFSDQEWENILMLAEKRGLSTRAFISSLVEKELKNPT